MMLFVPHTLSVCGNEQEPFCYRFFFLNEVLKEDILAIYFK